MNKITEVQMQIFQLRARQQADSELERYARERYPEVSPQFVRSSVDRARSTADRYEIQSQNDVATILDLTIMYGADFSESTWANPILSNSSLSSKMKIATLKSLVNRKEKLL